MTINYSFLICLFPKSMLRFIFKTISPCSRSGFFCFYNVENDAHKQKKKLEKKTETSKIYWYVSGMTKHVCRKIYTQTAEHVFFSIKYISTRLVYFSGAFLWSYKIQYLSKGKKHVCRKIYLQTAEHVFISTHYISTRLVYFSGEFL